MKPDFSKLNGLLPAVIQDDITSKVLMVGFMNKEALKETKKTGLVTFYSRSKNRLWKMGEESGNYLHVVDILSDYDSDSMLIKVYPAGPVGEEGHDTCFKENNQDERILRFLIDLQDLIDDRREKRPKGSYTTKLFKKGINKIAKKFGEEAIELVIEAKDKNDILLLNEAADLMYHLQVLLSYRQLRIEDLVRVLKERHEE